MNKLKAHWPAIQIIILVSWFWLFLALIAINVFLNKQLLAERARNDRLEENIKLIEEQLPSGRVILELEK
mgnify:CR=1 FL=1